MHFILDYLLQRTLDQGHVWSMINYNEYYIQYLIFVHLIRKQANPYGRKMLNNFFICILKGLYQQCDWIL